MTTVVDPLGTASVTFNRSGLSIVSIDVHGGDNGVLPLLPGQTKIYLLSDSLASTTSMATVTFPSGAEIGDVCHIISKIDQTANGYSLPSGESLVTFGNGTTSIPWTRSLQLMKVSDTGWAPLVSI